MVVFALEFVQRACGCSERQAACGRVAARSGRLCRWRFRCWCADRCRSRFRCWCVDRCRRSDGSVLLVHRGCRCEVCVGLGHMMSVKRCSTVIGATPFLWQADGRLWQADIRAFRRPSIIVPSKDSNTRLSFHCLRSLAAPNAAVSPSIGKQLQGGSRDGDCSDSLPCQLLPYHAQNMKRSLLMPFSLMM